MYASRVYIGHTGHSRLTPVKHSFRYSVNYYVFDLDELQKLSDGVSYYFACLIDLNELFGPQKFDNRSK